MKLINFKENKFSKDIFLVLTALMGFIFIVSFSALYVSDAIKNNNACGCVIPIPYMILMLSSLGLFIGSLAFYILISKHLNEKKEISKNIELTLKFLEKNEKSIVRSLIKNKEPIQQSKLESETGMHKVKIHRTLDKLIQKGIIEKLQEGKINKIKLKEELKDIFN